MTMEKSIQPLHSISARGSETSPTINMSWKLGDIEKVKMIRHSSPLDRLNAYRSVEPKANCSEDDESITTSLGTSHRGAYRNKQNHFEIHFAARFSNTNKWIRYEVHTLSGGC